MQGGKSDSLSPPPPLTFSSQLASDHGIADNNLRRQPSYESSEKKAETVETDAKKQKTARKSWNDPGLTRKQQLKLICQRYQVGGCNLKNCKFDHVCTAITPSGLCGEPHPMADHP